MYAYVSKLPRFQYFEITMKSRQLDCEFENTLVTVNSKTVYLCSFQKTEQLTLYVADSVIPGQHPFH